MRKDVYRLILIVSVLAGTAVGVAIGPVVRGYLDSLELCLVWGHLGLGVGLLITYAILRRRDVVKWTLLGAWFPIVIMSVFPGATFFPEIQAARNGQQVIDASDLASLPRRPIYAKLTGIWREDRTYRGRFVKVQDTGGGETNNLTTCRRDVYDFCRTPVVGPGWKPGDPVFAISSHACSGHKPWRRSANVYLYPADHPGAAAQDFTERDWDMGTIDRVDCVNPPPPPKNDRDDPNKLPFHFDLKHGFLVVPGEGSAQANLVGSALISLLFCLVAVVVVFKISGHDARILRRDELAAQAAAGGADPGGAGDGAGGTGTSKGKGKGGAAVSADRDELERLVTDLDSHGIKAPKLRRQLAVLQAASGSESESASASDSASESASASESEHTRDGDAYSAPGGGDDEGGGTGKA